MSNCLKYVLADDVPSGVGADPLDGQKNGDGPQKTAPGGEPTLGEVLQVVFNVGVGEHEVYVALAARGPTSAGDLARELDRNRSNVSRHLRSLFEKDLATRRRRILQSGGHAYEYSARSPEQVRQLLLAGLRRWTHVADERIDELVTEIAEGGSRMSS